MITTEQLRQHLRLDGSNEDEYLTLLIEASKGAVEKHVNRPLSEFDEIPAQLQMAILLIAANLYSNREPISYANSVVVPYSYNYLVQPFIKYRNANESGIT